MFSSASRRKSSHRKRPKPHLSIDTACTDQKKVFPYDSRIQDLTFVSFEESKARKKVHARKASLKQQIENLAPVQPGPQLVVPKPQGSRDSVRSHKAAIVGPEIAVHNGQDSLALPFNKRIKGLRPSPLDLTRHVSPSDRVIPIGIVLSPSTVSNRTPSPQATPMIVITPSSEHPRDQSYRPTSSVYSRYTNCFPKSGAEDRTPPVPPLPLFINTGLAQTRAGSLPKESPATIFEEEVDSVRANGNYGGIDDRHAMADDSHRSMLPTAGLPTSRRSKGWWNVITSPFSAKSAKSLFWRTPSLRGNHADRMPVLGDAAAMGVSNPHAGVIFTNRRLDDDELRSAPASGPSNSCDDEPTRAMPKRSDTAPGALDGDATGVNIYRIPSTGEAAPYYDSNRHFPSLYLQSRSLEENDIAGWSPSQSVFMPGRYSHSAHSDFVHSPEVTVLEAALEAEGITKLVDNHSNLDRSAFSPLSSPGMSHVPEHPRAAMLSTPSEDELKTPPRTITQPSRGFTQTTDASFMSPLSATPVVQDAHMGRVVGPQSSFGEQKQVDVERTPIPPGPGLATATMAHRESDDVAYGVSTAVVEEQASQRPVHVRQDSYDLGISAGERELYPAPVPLSEKPRLGTDRFGQLTIRGWDDDKPQRPWYKRFFWLLAAGASSILLVIVVLLAVFIPQNHDDIAVQASWLNLTGLPALPVGVSTVIQPKNIESTDSCVSPSNLWSCAAPTQESASPPDFRLQIRFRNGTLPSNETAVAITSSSTKRWQDSSTLHQFVKRNLWTAYLYSAYPSAPSQSDQDFLGRTTDNVTEPYNGEETPFYLSLLDPVALSPASLHKRDEDYSYPYPSSTSSSAETSTASTVSTATANDIPSPALKSNGEPTDQVLYPLVSSQPLRLYNRGEDSEHYGFYTYYDRSVYISGVSSGSPSMNSSTNITSNALLKNASAVCTFSQTRLHVRIWTRKGTVGSLNTGAGAYIPAGNSSANDMAAPGSFPYRVTITVDRHGGEADKKGVYCYRLDEGKTVISDAKSWLAENRAVGGSLVNPAAIPGSSNTTLDKRDDDVEGGIDGGSGGCNCQWQNWS